MYFTWIGTLILEAIKFIFKKFSISKAGYFVVVPMYVLYITLIFTSWTLFLGACIQIVNSLFDLLNMINFQNTSSSSTPVFKCFFYLLNSLGIAAGLKTGIALIVSDILVVITLKSADAFKITTKEIIVTTNGIFDK